MTFDDYNQYVCASCVFAHYHLFQMSSFYEKIIENSMSGSPESKGEGLKTGNPPSVPLTRNEEPEKVITGLCQDQDQSGYSFEATEFLRSEINQQDQAKAQYKQEEKNIYSAQSKQKFNVQFYWFEERMKKHRQLMQKADKVIAQYEARQAMKKREAEQQAALKNRPSKISRIFSSILRVFGPDKQEVQLKKKTLNADKHAQLFFPLLRQEQ